MGWQFLLRPEVRDFISAHADDDVTSLALMKGHDMGADFPLVLDQIRVRQKAKSKSPEWFDTDSIVFPVAHDFEQSSSFSCGLYKAGIVSGGSFVDLTSGTGMDAFCFSQVYKRGICVEREEVTAEILKHNLSVFGQAGRLRADVSVVCGEAHEVLQGLEPVDLLYIDPQRRDNVRKGYLRLEDCSPDITALLPLLLEKGRRVMIKTSPLLDISQTIETLKFVCEVHVVAWQGDCREVLYVLDPAQMSHDPLIVAVRLDDQGQCLEKFSFRISEERGCEISYGMPQRYIYEPGPAFQKAGGFQVVASRFGVTKFHQHTHLYSSDHLISDFPGKVYELVCIAPVKAGAAGVDRADLKLRNFPGHVDSLRCKLKLHDGGDYRIYACTLADMTKKLVVCRKIGV
ncbi:MAG: hypothetical protein KDI13_03440 [Alphaproteobacteria bacterium]|nr:hypothetical protein [Alphaproteobacteria bacterium]